MFITFEGPEGSGKTTQIAGVAAWLREHGHIVLCTREPGGTPISDQVRAILMEPDNHALVPIAEFLLFSASRAQHVAERVRPALAAGQVVLCDRFVDSSLAYQGYGHGLPLETLHAVSRFATGGLVPDLTLLLDVEVTAGLRRRRAAVTTEGAEWNRLDAQTLAFHQRVRDGYRRLAAAEPARWRVVDAAHPPDVVQRAIRHHLASFLAARGEEERGPRS